MMRLTLDLLGHHLEVTIDHPSEGGEAWSEGSVAALVERADRYDIPTLGFAPPGTSEAVR